VPAFWLPLRHGVIGHPVAKGLDDAQGEVRCVDQVALTSVQSNFSHLVRVGKSVVDPSNAKHMWVALNALTPAVYTVTWVAVAADGHRMEGEYTFTVK
jgi:methionine-rich copper-binding protein CopC